MAVTLTIDFDIAFVITARRDGTVTDRNTGETMIIVMRRRMCMRMCVRMCLRVGPWIANANAPRRAVRTRAEHAHISAEIDQPVLHSGALKQRRSAINRVFLAKAAKVQLHARTRQRNAFAIPCDVLPTH